MYNILWMEYLPAFGHLVKNHQNQDSPPLERMGILLPRILRIGRIVSYARLGAKQKQDKPLGEDGGLRALVPKLPPWSYKSKLLTPKPKT